MDKHNIWHAAYCRWYDHREAGHRTRAAVWGWIADRICDTFWPKTTNHEIGGHDV